MGSENHGQVCSSVGGYIFKLLKDFATGSSALGLFWCIVPSPFACNKAMHARSGNSRLPFHRPDGDDDVCGLKMALTKRMSSR